MQIRNKIVVVTGASSGIGAAIAKQFAKKGAAKIVLLARDSEKLNDVAAELESAGARAHFYSVDLSGHTEVEDVAQRIRREVGEPDIIVNNAGVGSWRYLHESSPDEIRQMMALPYFAAAWLTRLFLPGMLKRGVGYVVNISSVASRMAWPGATAYIAACRALRGLSDALREDLRGSGIKVSHYESGPVETTYWLNNPGSRERVPGIAKLLLPVLNEDKVANAVINGISKEKRYIVVPFILQAIYAMHYIAPAIVQWLMTATGVQRPRKLN